MDFQKGQIIGGRFEVEQRLGEGGFGITYKVRHTQLGTPFVIKTPRSSLRFEPEYQRFVDKFQQEGLLLAKLAQEEPHDHIVRVFDLFDQPDEEDRSHQIPCLLMDFIAGEDLYKRVNRQGALTEAEAVRYIQQIGSALTVVHQAGLIHWDVTPLNIMLRNNSNKAVLIDFGIAGDCPPTSFSRSFGNQAFAPYEQTMLGKRTAQVDIYTLAASLYYAVTKKLPTSSCERKLSDQKLVPPQDYANISTQLNSAILAGMALEPQDRPASVQEWLKLLVPAAATDDLSSAKGVDYRKLRDLLKEGRWQEADEETAARMLEVAGREEEGWLDDEHIDNFPCEDLRTIDQLWVKYSEGRFGFSVQAKIYRSLGGTRSYDDKIWDAFADRVGWRKQGDWLSYSDLTFNTSAPCGHLPAGLWDGTIPDGLLGGFVWVWRAGVVVLLWVLFSRVETCKV